MEYHLSNHNDALLYIKSCLSSGLTFSNMLLELDLDSGRIISDLPSFIEHAHTMSFKIGGVLPREDDVVEELTTLAGDRYKAISVTNNLVRREIESKLAAFISTYLEESAENCVVFEHGLAAPTDPWLNTSNITYLAYENEVYLLLTPEDADDISIINTLRTANTYYLVGALTSASYIHNLSKGERLSVDRLRQLAQRADYIIVGSHDGEGELVWVKE